MNAVCLAVVMGPLTVDTINELQVRVVVSSVIGSEMSKRVIEDAL